MEEEKSVIMTTMDYIPGKRITKIFGTIWGVTVRSRGVGGNFMAGLRALKGGEIKEYTQMLSEARNIAMEHLRDSARQIGANAVISIRFDSSELGQVMSEIVAYGTAAIVEDVGGEVERVSLS